MSKSDNGPMMYEVFPAVAALNQVQGFNPLKMLRRMISPQTGEEVLRLDLQYKKLWFRLRHPEGRIRMNPLRITEQIAIYEAQVYLNREDPAPVCSFTSSISKDEAPGGKYIQAAQDDAADHALSDAGFGIQLSDVSEPVSMRHYGSEIPVSQLKGNTAVLKGQVKVTQPVDKPVVQAPSAPEQSATALRQSPVPQAAERPAQVTQNVAPAQPTLVPKAVQPKPVVPVQEQPKPAQAVHAANAALEVLRGNSSTTKTMAAPASAAMAEVDDADLPYTFGPVYNNSMSPEEIAAVMTLDQAKTVVVDTGVCKGMTMGEVAEKRPVSLKFYIFGGYRGDNNILKAAAKVIYEQLQTAA